MAIYVSTADSPTITNTTTEMTLIPNQINIPAGYMVVGSSLRITLWGTILTKAVNPGTLQLRLRWTHGGVFDVLSSAVLSLTPHTGGDTAYLMYYVTSRAAGFVANGIGIFFSSLTGADFRDLRGAGIPYAIDTSQAAILDVTAQWQTADASNIIGSTNVLLELLTDASVNTGGPHIPP